MHFRTTRAWRAAALAAAVLATVAGSASAESLEEKLSQMLESNAEGYLRPITEGLGADLNTCLFHSAKPHGVLGFDVGLKIMAVPMPDEAKFFTATVGSESHESATAVGPEDGGATFTFGGGTTLPGGIGADVVPVAVPQASIGLPFKTDVILRYLPAMEIDDEIGEFKYLGLGVKHRLNQYIPLPSFPLDLAAYGVLQKLEIGDILWVSNQSFGLIASKSIPLITIYGGFAVESSQTDVTYTYVNPSGPDVDVDLEMDSDVTSRLNVGAKLTFFPLLFVQADYSKLMGSDVAKNAYGVGLGLNLR